MPYATEAFPAGTPSASGNETGLKAEATAAEATVAEASGEHWHSTHFWIKSVVRFKDSFFRPWLAFTLRRCGGISAGVFMKLEAVESLGNLLQILSNVLSQSMLVESPAISRTQLVPCAGACPFGRREAFTLDWECLELMHTMTSVSLLTLSWLRQL